MKPKRYPINTGVSDRLSNLVKSKSTAPAWAMKKFMGGFKVLSIEAVNGLMRETVLSANSGQLYNAWS